MDTNSDDSDKIFEFPYNFIEMNEVSKGPNKIFKEMKISRYFDPPKSSSIRSSSRRPSANSVRSAYEFRPSVYNYSQNQFGTSSQSVYNPRSASPISVCAPALASATDIALSLEANRFNRLDVEIIKKKYKVFLKKYSGYDSGELGSDSSLSDDDYRSTRSYKPSTANSASANSKQCPVRNVHAIKPSTLTKITQNKSTSNQLLQKDRFKNRFLLPSQRFNNSAMSNTTIKTNVSKENPNFNWNRERNNNNKTNEEQNHASQSNHEIFSELKVVDRENNGKRKRKFDEIESVDVVGKKKQKLSPIKKSSYQIIQGAKNTDNIDNDESNDFPFVKPTFPISKMLKSNETVISRSAQPHFETAQTTQLNKSLDKDKTVNNRLSEPTEDSVSTLASQPSFIKRKLFTQNLDVIQNKNLSLDNLNSPINTQNKTQKEKNKTRKIVTTQSCLNRDVQQENSFLDLINKIVPQNQINSTKQYNKASGCNENFNDKWDDASIISNCNSQDESETFTDEDNPINITNTVDKPTKKPLMDVRVVMKRDNSINMNNNLPVKNNNEKLIIASNKQELENKDKDKPKKRIKVFWDTDIESDFESLDIQKNNNTLNKEKVTEKNDKTEETSLEQPKRNLEKNNRISDTQVKHTMSTNNSTASVYQFKASGLKIRSHRVPYKMKCCTEQTVSNHAVNDTINKAVKNHKSVHSERSNASKSQFCNSKRVQNYGQMQEQNDSLDAIKGSYKDVTKIMKGTKSNKTNSPKTNRRSKSRNIKRVTKHNVSDTSSLLAGCSIMTRSMSKTINEFFNSSNDSTKRKSKKK